MEWCTRFLPADPDRHEEICPIGCLADVWLLRDSFLVKGKYVVFTVDASTFGVRDWTLTGAPNPLDITGEVPTIVFASKIPRCKAAVVVGFPFPVPDAVRLKPRFFPGFVPP